MALTLLKEEELLNINGGYDNNFDLIDEEQALKLPEEEEEDPTDDGALIGGAVGYVVGKTASMYLCGDADGELVEAACSSLGAYLGSRIDACF